MENKKQKIIIYNPEVIYWGVAAGFHGYAISFIDKYADCIYLNKGFINRLRYRRQLWRVGIKRYIPFISKLDNTSANDKLVGFVVPLNDDENLAHFKGTKFFHLMDYYLFVSLNKTFLDKYKIDYVIGHTAMDKNCSFFKEYYPDYIGRVIDLPFGYQKRFKNIKPFKERKNIAVGLGSINLVDDLSLEKDVKKEFISYFSDEKFMHPLRRYIQTHEAELADVIDSKFPSPEKQKDFSYDAVEALNEYTMFINDAGLANFPPARTYEGIACGCVMVAEDNEIYRALGFVPDVNYIAFDKGNYQQMKEKIDFYINNAECLECLQKNSLELAKLFSHEAMAEKLYMEVLDTNEESK